MTCNYRIIQHDTKKPVYFAIHEVFYGDKGKPEGWTAEPIDIVGDSVKEVMQALQHMCSDTKQPVLKESELEKITKAV